MSGPRVIVKDEPMMERVRFAVVHDLGDGRRVFLGVNGTQQWIAEPGQEPEPTADVWLLTLPYQAADLIIDALVRWRDKAPPPGDAQALRRDLDAERARVDKLMDAFLDGHRAGAEQGLAVTQIALRLAEQP